MPEYLEQVVGIKEVAKKAQVSMSAVSMALAGSSQIADATRQRVREVCRELNYVRPTRQKRQGNGNGQPRFGFILLGSEVRDEAYLDLIRALGRSTTTHGGRLEVHEIPDLADPEALLRGIQEYSHELEGVLLMGLIDSELIEELKLCGISPVILGSVEKHAENERPYSLADSVDTDIVSMGRFAVNRLMERGCRRIGFVCETAPKGMYNDLWLDGYRLAHDRAGVRVAPGLIHIAGESFAGGEPAAEAYAALPALPDGYIIPDARIAASFQAAMAARGSEVDPERMVISGTQTTVRNYHLEDTPALIENIEAMADVAIDLMWRIRGRNTTYGVRALVPFLTRNMGESSG